MAVLGAVARYSAEVGYQSGCIHAARDHARSHSEDAVYEFSDNGPLLDIHDYIDSYAAVDDPEEDVEPLDDEATVKTVKMVFEFLWKDCQRSAHKTFCGAFYRAFSTSFRITKFLRGRGEFNGDEDILTLNCECPFGRFHGLDPKGAYVADANWRDNGRGFFLKCHHAHSGAPGGPRDFSTVEMLAEALERGWFTRKDMLNPRYLDRNALPFDMARWSETHD